MITSILIVLGLFLFISLVLKRLKSNFLLPPGPVGIPFFGYWPTTFGDRPYDRFDDWAKKYGEIYTVRIGGNKYFVLNTFDSIRQAFILDGNGNNFSARPQTFSIFGSAFDFRAVAWTNGAEWTLQRKLFASLMRRSDSRLTNAMRQSTDEIIRQIEVASWDGPIDIYNILTEGILNTISTLVCGQRLMETDPDYAKQIIRDARQIFEIAPSGDGFIFGWIVRILANPFTKTYKTLENIKSRQFKAIVGFIHEHELTFDPSNIRDYIDACLNERYKSKSSKEQRDWLCDANLVYNALDFFVGGIDTTSTTLYMALFLLAKHQDVQERCYDELKSVVGEDLNELSKISDKSKLQYLTAVIDEINRYGILAPLPQGRENIKKTSLLGYDIPARSNIVANLWSATRDTKYFANPNQFDPNNFYQKDLPRELASLPFSLGKRGCPGENLATFEIFVILSNLLFNFKFFPEPDIELKETIIPGFARCLAPFKLIFTKR